MFIPPFFHQWHVTPSLFRKKRSLKIFTLSSIEYSYKQERILEFIPFEQNALHLIVVMRCSMGHENKKRDTVPCGVGVDVKGKWRRLAFSFYTMDDSHNPCKFCEYREMLSEVVRFILANNRPFSLCTFCFPNTDQVLFLHPLIFELR